MIPGLLPIFLHSCKIKSGSGLETRLNYWKETNTDLPLLGLGIFAFRIFCKCLIFGNIATLHMHMSKSFSSPFSTWKEKGRKE